MPIDRPKLYTAGAVLTRPDEPLLADGAVLVRGENIVEVGPRRAFGEEPDADVVDLGAGVLAPGLIDPHVHLGFDGSDQPAAAMRSGDDATLAVAHGS